jgi:hypothetical protein
MFFGEEPNIGDEPFYGGGKKKPPSEDGQCVTPGVMRRSIFQDLYL